MWLILFSSVSTVAFIILIMSQDWHFCDMQWMSEYWKQFGMLLFDDTYCSSNQNYTKMFMIN